MKLTKLNCVKNAEAVILKMSYEDHYGNRKIGITTSKIRTILSMISELYNDAVHLPGDALNEDLQSRLSYLKMHFAYESGRDEKGVKELVKQAGIFEAIDEIQNSKDQLIVFCRYIESLVAYRKYYCGND